MMLRLPDGKVNEFQILAETTLIISALDTQVTKLLKRI